MIEAAEPVNYDALDALKSVLGLDFPDLVREFRQQATDTIVKLELALEHNDLVRVKNLLHILKGSALSLHCKPLAESCSNLEHGIQGMEREQIEAELAALKEILRDTLLAIEVWIA